jgi:hypothetical protein
MAGMLAPAGINDDDVRHAHRTLANHQAQAVSDAPARCQRCGGYYPCVPSQIATTVLLTSRTPPDQVPGGHASRAYTTMLSR